MIYTYKLKRISEFGPILSHISLGVKSHFYQLLLRVFFGDSLRRNMSGRAGSYYLLLSYYFNDDL